MMSLKYIICLSVVVTFSTLMFLGCETERYTTKFEVTPFMEDGVTSTENLSMELKDELRIEDEKRLKGLREKDAAEGSVSETRVE